MWFCNSNICWFCFQSGFEGSSPVTVRVWQRLCIKYTAGAPLQNACKCIAFGWWRINSSNLETYDVWWVDELMSPSDALQTGVCSLYKASLINLILVLHPTQWTSSQVDLLLYTNTADSSQMLINPQPVLLLFWRTCPVSSCSVWLRDLSHVANCFTSKTFFLQVYLSIKFTAHVNIAAFLMRLS